MRTLVRVIALCAAFATVGCADKPHWNGVDLTGSSWGRELTLTDPDGRRRTLAEFRGRPVMVFFGFTQCPDVCPTALIRATEIRKLLGADGVRLQVIFVTVDPERDTPSLLREYTAAFDKDFLGLRGDEATTKKVADEFHVFYEKVPTGKSYTVNHTSLSYVFDTEGRLRLGEPHAYSAAQVAEDLKQLLGPARS